jgi:hypothetical protein
MTSSCPKGGPNGSFNPRRSKLPSASLYPNPEVLPSPGYDDLVTIASDIMPVVMELQLAYGH